MHITCDREACPSKFDKPGYEPGETVTESELIGLATEAGWFISEGLDLCPNDYRRAISATSDPK